MKQNKISIILLCLASMLTASCATDIGANSYTDATVGEASFTYQGTIISARRVNVSHADSLDKNQTGMAMGGISGAVIGNQFGKGGGNTAATIGGALLGATAGA